MVAIESVAPARSYNLAEESRKHCRSELGRDAFAPFGPLAQPVMDGRRRFALGAAGHVDADVAAFERQAPCSSFGADNIHRRTQRRQMVLLGVVSAGMVTRFRSTSLSPIFKPP